MKPEKENKTKQQQTSNKIITQAYQSRALPESHQVRPEHDAIRNGFPVTLTSGAFLNQKPNKQTRHE